MLVLALQFSRVTRRRGRRTPAFELSASSGDIPMLDVEGFGKADSLKTEEKTKTSVRQHPGANSTGRNLDDDPLVHQLRVAHIGRNVRPTTMVRYSLERR